MNLGVLENDTVAVASVNRLAFLYDPMFAFFLVSHVFLAIALVLIEVCACVCVCMCVFACVYVCVCVCA